jgi:spore coat protein H
MSRSISHFVWLAFLPGVAVAEEPPATGERIFSTTKVAKFQLTMSEKSFAALSPAGGGQFAPPPGFGPPRPQAEGTHRNTFGVDFPWSKGELAWDGKAFPEVGIRYKGNFTFMATARSLKKSLKLDLNKNVEGQKLDGLTMLNFNCGITDSSQTREAFTYAYFRSAGVPAPRTGFAELSLTVPGKYEQELVGVYTVVEQVNKGFLKRYFGDGKGMLLKPEGLPGGLLHLGKNWKAYEDKYKPDGTPTEAQKQRLIEFTQIINTGSEEAFANEIAKYLDVNAFLKFLAANALLSNLDSYLGFGHNYYLYLVPSTNRFVFIPWDLDLALATWPAAGTPEQLVELSIRHPHAGTNKLIDRLFAIAEHKKKYLAILEEMTATSFTSAKLLASLSEIETTLKESLAKETKAIAARKEPKTGGPFGGVQFGQSLPPRKFIEKRTASVAAQLAGKTEGFEPKAFGFGFAPPPPAGSNKDR